MISTRKITDPRTGDCAIQAFAVLPDGTLLTAERVLRYIDLETPDRAKVIEVERKQCVQELQEVLDARHPGH